MSGKHNKFIFVGPSFPRWGDAASTLGREFIILPPAKRGDIAALTDSVGPGVIVIVDGRFHQCLAVGHAEIREAIHSGWEMWGVSSLGAIRASEMRDWGMKGFGEVYRLYVEEEDFEDDEVALLHGPMPPYPSFSEPLIHLRFAIEDLRKHSFLETETAQRITTVLKEMWYGKQTLELFYHLVDEAVPDAKRDSARKQLNSFERFRIKNLDLIGFLKAKPWET